MIINILIRYHHLFSMHFTQLTLDMLVIIAGCRWVSGCRSRSSTDPHWGAQDRWRPGHHWQDQSPEEPLWHRLQKLHLHVASGKWKFLSIINTLQFTWVFLQCIYFSYILPIPPAMENRITLTYYFDYMVFILCVKKLTESLYSAVVVLKSCVINSYPQISPTLDLVIG